ncbi:LytTR family DNA-binding domain-containing protein [Streptococcus sp. P25B114]|uniref:Regulatory protein n=2 Tax=Streptococcus suis TaxID=1307 RepID=A0A0H3MUT6_STRS4|nr:LytTR family DNA-binding domain-containing protein [Streptococcus suis]HEM3195783.1 LytTR family transcriptional regulator DNA-binding domain-containing protein [Streptococcus suis 10581]MBY4978371.1 LytTR family transcriptional regulator DNA-binding domain-containing protein [Streptococcus suis]MBY4978388.1 LytTR family transcriptional regulator DNA-binding domain-containing protein [Streptococcus suis]NQK42210.1 LytTR family transcriptional regulator [Streptococcus suis]NQK46136.1 LytTR f
MNFLIVNKDDISMKLFLEDIFYISSDTTKPHMLKAVTESGVFEFYGTLKDLEDKLKLNFFRCHRKFLVNIDKIQGLNLSERLIVFTNDGVGTISFSRYKQKELNKLWRRG